MKWFPPFCFREGLLTCDSTLKSHPFRTLSATSRSPGQKVLAVNKWHLQTLTVTRYNQAFHPSQNPTGNRFSHR